jgi:hypothetical protein
LELRRLQTLVEADIAAALSLHASDYQLITPNGEPASGDEYLGMIGRGEFVYDVFEPASDIAVRAYGEVVAVRYQGPDRSSLERRERSRVVLAHGYLRAARWALAGSVVSGDADRGADLASGGVLLTSPSAPFPTRVPTVCKPRPAPFTTVGTAAVLATVSWVMAETVAELAGLPHRAGPPGDQIVISKRNRICAATPPLASVADVGGRFPERCSSCRTRRRGRSPK